MVKPLADICVIFDLDGTLVDTAPDLANAMNAVLETQGLQPLPLNQVRNLIGHGAKALLQYGLEANNQSFNEEYLEELVGNFIAYYKAHIVDESQPFPGCLNMLDKLDGLGACLAVCTNKRHELAVPVLALTGLASYFPVIIGRDSLPEHKPSALPLLTCIERSTCKTGIMIGDSQTDHDAAQNANIPIFLTKFGYDEVSTARFPEAVLFDHFQELPELILQNRR